MDLMIVRFPYHATLMDKPPQRVWGGLRPPAHSAEHSSSVVWAVAVLMEADGCDWSITA